MKDSQRERLMLLDTAVAALPMRPAALAIWSQRHSASRYRFDTEASGRVGEMMCDCLDLMVDNIEFARTPYPTCYFELDSIAMWRAWRQKQPILATHDKKVGFLVHHGSVLVIATGDRPDSHRAAGLPDNMICGLTFRINRPQAVPFTKLTSRREALADIIKQSYVFGGQRGGDAATIRRIREGRAIIDDGVLVSLPPLPGAWTHSQVAAHFDIMPTFTTGTGDDVAQMCFHGGGDPMILTTMLLLLNQPSKFVSLTEVKREPGIFKGRRFTFKGHHIIKMSLSGKQHVRDIFHTTDRAPAINHPVEGHWKHYNKSLLGCSHHHPDGRRAWEPVGPERTLSDDYKRYWCPLCLQRRTWTENFRRGGGGYASNEHEVTA